MTRMTGIVVVMMFWSFCFGFLNGNTITSSPSMYYTWIVSVHSSYSTACVGSVISPVHVLTTASCFKAPSTGYIVTPAAVSVQLAPSTPPGNYPRTYVCRQLWIHPSYDGSTPQSQRIDVAICELFVAIDGAVINPVWRNYTPPCLLSSTCPDTPLIHALHGGGGDDAQLSYISFTPVTCPSTPFTLRAPFFCLRPQDSSQDVCPLDYGTPIVITLYNFNPNLVFNNPGTTNNTNPVPPTLYMAAITVPFRAVYNPSQTVTCGSSSSIAVAIDLSHPAVRSFVDGSISGNSGLAGTVPVTVGVSATLYGSNSVANGIIIFALVVGCGMLMTIGFIVVPRIVRKCRRVQGNNGNDNGGGIAGIEMYPPVVQGHDSVASRLQEMPYPVVMVDHNNNNSIDNGNNSIDNSQQQQQQPQNVLSDQQQHQQQQPNYNFDVKPVQYGDFQ